MDILIKQLGRSDLGSFSELLKVFENVFEWTNISHPQSHHLQKILDKAHLIIIVAIANNKVVGGLTAHVLDRYDSEKPSAYIYDIGVLPQYQRKGIGKKLIDNLNNYCRDRGFSETFVQAETEDTQAVNFYRTTSISNELQATHFTYHLNQ